MRIGAGLWVGGVLASLAAFGSGAVAQGVAPSPAAEPAAPAVAVPAAAPAPPPGPLVAYVVHKPPIFSATTTLFPGGSALTGVAEVVHNITEGDAIIADNHIEDPARATGLALAKAWAKAARRHGAGQPLTSAEAGAGAGAGGPGVRYVVDVATETWAFGPYFMDYSEYHLIYDARLRVTDTATGKVVASGWRHHKAGPKATDSFTIQQVGDESEYGLRAHMRMVGEECLAKFMAAAKL